MKEAREKERKKKIKSVKFTLPIKRKINVASRARLPKAIIFEIQDPSARISWKPKKDYLFMVSRCKRGEGPRSVYSRPFDVASNRPKLKRVTADGFVFYVGRLFMNLTILPTAICTGNDVGVWDSSRAQIRVMTRVSVRFKQRSEKRQRRTWWRSLGVEIYKKHVTHNNNNDDKISDRLYIDRSAGDPREKEMLRGFNKRVVYRSIPGKHSKLSLQGNPVCFPASDDVLRTLTRQRCSYSRYR